MSWCGCGIIQIISDYEVGVDYLNDFTAMDMFKILKTQQNQKMTVCNS